MVLQLAGASEKTSIEMLSSDLVAELRAEVRRGGEGVCVCVCVCVCDWRATQNDCSARCRVVLHAP